MASNISNVLGGTRVLCVDDSPDALELLVIVLRNHGAEIVAVSSAEAAIALLRVESFDVIVSDLQMPPGLDGYDLAHELRKMERNDSDRPVIPTVAVSGDAMTPSMKRRFADFQVYLSKPFDHKLLVHVVARLAEADGAAVTEGSLARWEAKGLTAAAERESNAAKVATRAAAEGERVSLQSAHVPHMQRVRCQVTTDSR